MKWRNYLNHGKDENYTLALSKLIYIANIIELQDKKFIKDIVNIELCME